MRFSITFKLFLAILATCIIVALAMGMAVRFSFERGFDDYIQERELHRLQELAQQVANEYTEAGDWHFIGQNRKRLLRMLSFPKRLSLVAADGHWVFGPKVTDTHQYLRVAVSVEDANEPNGKVVAWLLSPPLVAQSINDAIDKRFQARQLHATWVIVGLSVLIAMLVSLMLARLLLVPVRKLARASHFLARGKYDTRVHVGTSDELGLLAQDFNRLAASLERNRELRHQLMADVSHELRTPLAVLRAEIEAIQDGLRQPDAAALNSLVHEVSQLNRLIDDLYELSLADAGALSYDMQVLDISSLIQASIEAVRYRYERAGIALELDLTAQALVMADAKRMQQVMANLLENSLRYTDVPGQVMVSCRRSGHEYELVIEDSPPGVAEENYQRLFERLYRVEASRSRQYGGVGLGLALSQTIIQAHGGSIGAGPSKMGGLAIKIVLPAYKGHITDESSSS